MTSDRQPTEPPESAPPERIDPGTVAALFVQHADELRRFIVGILRHADQASEVAQDVLQQTFVKALEQGHTARSESLKGWLFRVAYNEAIVARRRQDVRQRAFQKLADGEQRVAHQPETMALRRETILRVRAAIECLPPEQRDVVRRRMVDEQKFIDIAAELGLPLGTVLTRMQLALKKLRAALGGDGHR